MNVLAINDGFASSAALIVNGELKLMAQEERFNRIKNYNGIPELTLKWIFNETDIAPEDIDIIAVPQEAEPWRNITTFSFLKYKYFSILGGILGRNLLFQLVLFFNKNKRKRIKILNSLLKKFCLFDKKVIFVEHHLAHAAASYYSSGFKKRYKKSLIITYDDSGDGLCTTVSVASGNKIERVFSQNSYNSIARMYSGVTEFMGMTPLEHEYKLMGLAPYSSEKAKEQAYKRFKKYIKLSKDGLKFINTSHNWGNPFLKRLAKDFIGIRFDGIAAGLQQIFEEYMCRYIINWSKKLKIRNVVAGGGSFMNVKLNMILAQTRELNDFFVFPGCGEESLGLGAGFYAAENHAGDDVRIVKATYHGYKISEDEILISLKKYKNKILFQKLKDIEKKTAELLMQGNVVGRVKGRMEWGARALGNRSILADPSDQRIIKRINKVIKKRDFWLPFAPSILYEDRYKYTVNPKNVDSPFMILAFNSTDQAKKDIIAGLHPCDETCRPQFVRKEINPDYYKLIKYFKDLTGIGALLNTSCNIHGFPIVCTADDALRMLLDSGIDYMAIENYLCRLKKA